MKWEEKTLENVSLNIQTGPFGSQLHQSDYSIEGIPVVMPKDLIGGKISEASIARVTEDHVKRLSRHVIESGDILYSRRGDVGRCAFAQQKEVGWLCGTGCLRVSINPAIADARFIFYQLQQASTVGWVEKHAVGATMLNLNTSILSAVPVNMPPLDQQHRISDILSAYDNLIENNQKQIKLLEEAAQRLYKEWFVDLHFPGYEDTEIIDGVPEGWTERCVSNFGEVITGKTPSTEKTEYYGGDIPFVTIPDMHGKVFPLRTEKSLTKEGADIQKGKYLPKNTVIVSCIATVGLVNIATEICQTNQQINSVILTEEKDLYFFYESMKRIRALLDGVGSNGATMTNVNKTKFSNIKVLYPTEELVSNYYDFCLPIFNKILNLSVIMQNAQRARDRLLPKLMSGELEV